MPIQPGVRSSGGRLVSPRLGALAGVLLEAPIVLTVSWIASRWCCRRWHVSQNGAIRALMGAVAFSVLMVLELGISVAAFGETVEHYIEQFGTSPGATGLAMQICFAMIPSVQY